MAVVELEGLTKRFGDAVALDGLTLSIAHGSLVCLLGPSGCGKTTTLRLVAGFMDPDGGTIRVGDRIVSEPGRSLPPERRRMSMIFQSYALWPHMTIADNVGFGLRLRRLDRAERERRVAMILDVAHLSELAGRYPHELSGGQQQRAALARALVVEPETLLLDEPLSNLDANLREEMRFEIRRLHDTFHFTTVYVTHDQGEAMVTSDRIAVMNKGRIEQIDAPYAVYNRPRTRFVAGFIGRTNFVEASCEGGEVRFQGFALPRDVFEGGGELGRSVLFSVRPQSIALHRAAAAAPAGRRYVAGEIVERAYLGESWDYVAAPAESALRLKVSAPPVQIFEVGEKVWLEFDPRQMAPIT
jgi:ABC-type Fe3+/spermidine/putrescine transport system ATPase subunit